MSKRGLKGKARDFNWHNVIGVWCLPVLIVLTTTGMVIHTGEALGWFGQFIAALASLGGAFLVWTGFALSWRRYFPRRAPVTPSEPGTPPELSAR
jgi:uncharacterized iron-regulated membrane protein